MSNEIKVNDRVEFSRNFLQSTGQYTNVPSGGIVDAIIPCGGITLAEVRWSNGDVARVNVKNLILKSRMHLEAY